MSVANACFGLGAAVGEEDLLASRLGATAARVLAVALRTTELASPRTSNAEAVPVTSDDPAYPDVVFLARRGLLPETWEADALDGATWSDMLSRFRAWYGLDPIEAPPPASVDAIVADAAATLEDVAGAVRPLGLVAWDPTNDDAIAFVALVWNWTVFPRLIVHRPVDGSTLESVGGFQGALGVFANCVIRPERYIAAPVDTAIDLFMASNETRMVVLETEPHRGGVPRWIGAGDEIEAFAFRHAVVAESDVYSAAFAGPSLGPARLLQLLPRLRTNVPPYAVLRYLQTPP